MAETRPCGCTCPGSKLTVACSLARLTCADSTPGTFLSPRSIRFAQEAQVMPVTGSLSCLVAIESSRAALAGGKSGPIARCTVPALAQNGHVVIARFIDRLDQLRRRNLFTRIHAYPLSREVDLHIAHALEARYFLGDCVDTVLARNLRNTQDGGHRSYPPYHIFVACLNHTARGAGSQ